MLSTLYVWRVIGLLYAGSHRLLHNLTDVHRKPSACFGLHVDTVSMAYQRAHFIPTHTTINAKGAALLFLKEVWKHHGMP
jgi:hypothetical protein